MTTTNKNTLLWLLAFAGAFALIYLLRGVLLPFVVGLMVAYMLNPVVDRLAQKHIGRGLGSGLVLGSFFALVAGALMWLVPILANQLMGLMQAMPHYMEYLYQLVEGRLQQGLSHMATPALPPVENLLQAGGTKVLPLLGIVLGGIWQSSMAIAGAVSLILLTPLVAFYCLRDWHHFQGHVDALMPRNHKDTIRSQLREMDEVLSGFIRGQTMVCVIMGVFYAVALSIAGLNYGLLIGFLSGLLMFVPYLGSVLGIVAAVSIALVQFDGWQPVAIVAGIFAFGQLVESNFLTPKIVGDRVRLHPVWIIFGMLAGGTLLGVLGVLIAVPASAVVGVLVRFMVERYHQSSLYTDDTLEEIA